MTDLNPQHQQMADASMIRTLDAQARAIWPQESPLFARYALPDAPLILDAGCGTGEGASRLAVLYPRGRVLGVDILDQHLDLARRRHAALASRLTFEHQSIYELSVPDATRSEALLRVVRAGRRGAGTEALRRRVVTRRG